jgi:hypothetical protein
LCRFARKLDERSGGQAPYNEYRKRDFLQMPR